jgi:hypothetical protein
VHLELTHTLYASELERSEIMCIVDIMLREGSEVTYIDVTLREGSDVTYRIDVTLREGSEVTYIADAREGSELTYIVDAIRYARSCVHS